MSAARPRGSLTARQIVPLLVLLVAVARALAAMLIPLVRAPGWPDVILAVIAVAAAIYLFVTGPVSVPRRWAALVAGGFWLLPFLSGLVHGQSTSPATVAMAAVAVVLIAAPPDTSVLLRGAIASGGLVVLLSLLYGLMSAVGLLSGAFHSLPDYERALGGIPALDGIATHPNILGPLAALTVLISLPVALAGRGFGPWIIPALATIALLWTQSRSAILGLALGLGAWLLVSRRPAARGPVMGVSLLMVIAPAFVASSVWKDYLPIDSLFTGRVLAWTFGVLAFVLHPIFGYGPDIFSKSFWNDYPGQYWQPLHAHNLLIEVGAQSGLVGVTAFAALILVGVLIALKRIGRLGHMAVALLVLTAAQAAVEVPLGLTYFPISYLFPTLLVAALAYSGRNGNASAVP